MYKCSDCGGFFEAPSAKEMEPDTGYVEQTCPNCGSDYFDEAHECPVCRESYTVDEFCEDCCEALRQGLAEIRNRLCASPQDFEDMIVNHFGW